MFGLSVSFIAGYFVARYFGDAILAVAQAAYAEVGKVISEWL